MVPAQAMKLMNSLLIGLYLLYSLPEGDGTLVKLQALFKVPYPFHQFPVFLLSLLAGGRAGGK